MGGKTEAVNKTCAIQQNNEQFNKNSIRHIEAYRTSEKHEKNDAKMILKICGKRIDLQFYYERTTYLFSEKKFSAFV